MHTKHGNTISPGNRLRVGSGGSNVKTAGATGKALDVDQGLDLVKVEWDDGSVSFIDVEHVESLEEG